MVQSATYFSIYLQKRIMGISMQMGLPAEPESIRNFVTKKVHLSPLLRLEDATTHVEALTWATQEAGYPSQPQGGSQ